MTTTKQVTPLRDQYLAAKAAYVVAESGSETEDVAEKALEEARAAYRDSDEPRTWSFGGEGGEGAPDQFVRRPTLQALAEEGDWDCGDLDPVYDSIAVRVDAACEETGEELSELCVIDPDEPECPFGDHEWSDDHDLVGGCESNPGVHGVGAGITSDSVCALCGLGRTHYTCSQGSGVETEYDHDGVRYKDCVVDSAGLARHYDGVVPQAALDAYDGAGEDLVDACLAYRLEHGETLRDLVEDESLPAVAVAVAIRHAGKAMIEVDDGFDWKLCPKLSPKRKK